MNQKRGVLLLDACVLINLFASGYEAEILGSLDMPAAIVGQVQRETYYTRRGGAGDEARDLILIDLNSVLEQRLMYVIPDASEEELNTFIDFTFELGDGEAMTAALAIHRGFTVATDDRVALRAIGSRAPVRTSLELIKHWAEQQTVSPTTIRAALHNLWQRGSYMPGPQHPLRWWWDQYYGAE